MNESVAESNIASLEKDVIGDKTKNSARSSVLGGRGSINLRKTHMANGQVMTNVRGSSR